MTTRETERLVLRLPRASDLDAFVEIHEDPEVASRTSVIGSATGREAAKVLAAVQSPHFALNWDPGNAVMRGEMDAFPGGWDSLPKNRIHHCHCKNAVKDDAGKIVWSPVDKGYIDWTAQYRALKAAGYHDAVSLETPQDAGTGTALTVRSIVNWPSTRVPT